MSVFSIQRVIVTLEELCGKILWQQALFYRWGHLSLDSIANADFGPRVSAGQNPIVNYGGYVSNGTTVFTAPVDQDVILRTIITSTDCHGHWWYSDRAHIQLFYPTYLYTRASMHNLKVCSPQDAMLKDPVGSAMSFTGCSTTYYMEGYLSHP